MLKTKEKMEKVLREEFGELKSYNLPKVEEEWDLIWVLTGLTMLVEDGSGPNETEQRFAQAVKIAKEVTSMRNPRQAPKIYVSGYENHNDQFLQLKNQKYFEKNYGFPSKNILVGNDKNIKNTLDQFINFPKKLLEDSLKVVIITDAYHIPRTKRYASKYLSEYLDKLIFVPVNNKAIDEDKENEEIKKIIDYSLAGHIDF